MIPFLMLLITTTPVFAEEGTEQQNSAVVFDVSALPVVLQQERWDLAPSVTRAGSYRFLGSGLADPKWTPFYLKRFAEKQDSPAVKVALLDLILRSGGEWSEAIYQHLLNESDSTIRAFIIDMTKRLDSATAKAFIDFAVEDESPAVRAAAMRAIGNHLELDRSAVVVEALTDSSNEVKLMAIRTAGWSRNVDAMPNLIALLTDADNTIRLKSLYALQKINLEEAKSQIGKLGLQRDSNSSVQRLATKILSK